MVVYHCKPKVKFFLRSNNEIRGCAAMKFLPLLLAQGLVEKAVCFKAKTPASATSFYLCYIPGRVRET